MIAAVSASSVQAAAHPVPARRAGAPGAPAAFADMLASGDADEADPTTGRQVSADDGKAMPDAAPAPDGEAVRDEQVTADGSAAPLAWLATLTPPVLPPPVLPPPAPATPVVAVPVSPFQGTGVSAAAAPGLPATPPPTVPEASGPGAIPAATGAGLLALARDPALAAVHGPVEINVGVAVAAKDPPPIAPAGAAIPAALPAVMPGTSAPAGHVFAAALHAASSREERTERDLPAVEAAPAPAIHAAADLAPHAVTGAGDATGGGALDLADGHWPQAMMDRIERMRDDANAADTRIRLLPDRLGQIDVAVRREGDTLHVRFHAAEAETRGLLADAQPRLAEIAQGRGLRLGDTTVGGGGGGGRQQDRPAPPLAPPPAALSPATPPPATPRAGPAPSDIRIA